MRDALRIASPAARVVRVWPRRVRLALAASLCVLVGLIHAAYLPALLSVFARDRFDDFDLFYRSVRAVVDGGTLQWLAKSTGELNVNAPVFHLAVLPFAFVGAVPAAVLWAVAMLVAGGASLALVLGVLGVRPGVEGWLWLLLSLMLFPGPYAVVVSGGLAFSLMLPMTLAWSSARREQWVAAGAWLGVLVALKLFTAIFVVYLVVRRKWRGVLAMLGTAGGLALAGGWVFGWSAYVRWFQALAQVNWESGLLNGSLRGAVARAVLAGALPQPGAALAWTAAAVCGDSTLWKPASKTPLTAIATMKLAAEVCQANGVDPAIFSLVIGKGSTVGEKLLNDKRIPLVSATGSCAMGYRVGEVVGKRLGRTILELGGNNAIIVTPSANLDMAMRAILFGAVGTAGQRCTSTRRIIVHADIRDELVTRLVKAYKSVPIGNPLKEGTLMGPLVTHEAVADMQRAIGRIKEEGGEILYGGETLSGAEYPGGHYVKPCIAAAKNECRIVQEETFAPILYMIEYGRGRGIKGSRDQGKGAAAVSAVADVDEAIAIQNGVPQGLSSAIFTTNLLEAEHFLAHGGSDCGIANVNIGTSGAEIGGAFGGEKETGGGRESGSDSWKAYMRRQTNTLNWGTELPLAQGIKFGD